MLLPKKFQQRETPQNAQNTQCLPPIVAAACLSLSRLWVSMLQLFSRTWSTTRTGKFLLELRSSTSLIREFWAMPDVSLLNGKCQVRSLWVESISRNCIQPLALFLNPSLCFPSFPMRLWKASSVKANTSRPYSDFSKSCPEDIALILLSYILFSPLFFLFAGCSFSVCIWHLAATLAAVAPPMINALIGTCRTLGQQYLFIFLNASWFLFFFFFLVI